MRLETIPESGGVTANIAVTDIATAQEWVGRPGELSAILVRLSSPADRDAVAARLRELVPGDVGVEPPARRTGRVEAMIAAFRLNLMALSLVSLLVGMYFVGNAALASVVRHRVSLGILRAVGAGRSEIMALVLAESALTGIAGAVTGLLLSRPLAGVMAAPVARTVSALYLPVDARGAGPRSPKRPRERPRGWRQRSSRRGFQRGRRRDSTRRASFIPGRHRRFFP